MQQQQHIIRRGCHLGLTPIHTKDFIMTNNIASKKYLVNYPDGRYLGIEKLDYIFNKNREAFRMSEC
jgi:hypothetical protein